MKKVWNWITHHKLIVFLILLAAAGGISYLLNRNKAPSEYVQAQLEHRDLMNYNSFVGTVQADSDYKIIPKVAGIVQSVSVKAGEQVKQGQVIATLDSSSAEYAVALQEATLNQSGTSSYYSIKEAEESYENYKKTLEEGLNSSLITASSAKDSAWNAWQKAKKAYEEGSESIRSEICKAESALDSAKNARDAAKAVLDGIPDPTAQYNEKLAAFNAAQAKLQTCMTEEEIATLELELDPENPEKKARKEAAEKATKTAQVESDQAQLALAPLKPQYDAYTAAKSAYDAACVTYDTASAALKKLEDSEDSSLEALSQAATTAEHDFINANNSYFSTERSVQQQLETMAGTVEKLKATSGNAPARMELEHARQGLKDYTITAPISGTISTLSVTEGDLASTTAPVAVISGNDAMVIRIKIDEYSVLNAEVGKNVKIFIESIGETYDGTLRYVSDTAEITEGVSYYNAEVSFVPDDKVRSGMSTEVRLMIVDEHDVKCLPAEALYYRPDGSAYVYLWSGSELEERDIKIGVSDGDYVQVLEGIGEEDTVYFTYRTVNTDDSVIVLE